MYLPPHVCSIQAHKIFENAQSHWEEEIALLSTNSNADFIQKYSHRHMQV